MSDLTIKVFDKIKPRFVEIVDEATFLKEASFALQAVNKNKQLTKCTQESVIQALMNVAQCGLTLNPVLNLAYMIPRWNSKTRETECHVEPSYQGLAKLLTDTGSVNSISTQIVYEKDVFELVQGLNPDVKHTPALKDRGEIIGAYSVGRISNGEFLVEWMPIEDIHYIRDMSESYKAFADDRIKSCVWVDHEPEMCRKTVLKRFCKYAPKTEQWDKLGTAIELDNTDYIIDGTSNKATFIFSLMDTSSFDEPKRGSIEREIYAGVSGSRADEIIEELKRSQLDPLTELGSVNAGDVNKKVQEKIEQDG